MKIKTGPYRSLRRSFTGLLHGPVFDVRLAAHVSNRCKSGVRPVAGRT